MASSLENLSIKRRGYRSFSLFGKRRTPAQRTPADEDAEAQAQRFLQQQQQQEQTQDAAEHQDGGCWSWRSRRQRRGNVDDDKQQQQQQQHDELLMAAGRRRAKHGPEEMANEMTMYVNRGQDDELLVCGYRATPIRKLLTYVGILLTGGLLRLFFHWLPHLYLKCRCKPCEITEAEYVLATEIYNNDHKVHYVKPVHVLTPAAITARREAATRDSPDGAIVPDDVARPSADHHLTAHFGDGHFRHVDRLLMFACKKVKYIWDEEAYAFTKLHGLDTGVDSTTLHRMRGLTHHEAYTRRVVYGDNQIVVKEQSIPELLFLEVLNPFYIFQFCSFILWFVDNYYYYAAAILVMTFFGVSMTVVQTRRNQRNLKSTVHSSDVCAVVRQVTLTPQHGGDVAGTQWRSEMLPAELLVPGDIVEIPPHGCVMQCDALLLAGNCILNESMLTGESVPVTKTPFPNIAGVQYEPKEHARHTLFCGTQVIQTRYFGNEKVRAVVIRTGFQTAKGGLVRSILYPPPVDFKFEKDSYKFVMLLAGVAGIGFIYTVVTKTLRGVAAGEIVLNALDLITIVVPPALPAAMTVGRLYAQTRLQQDQIFCISPRTINVSGSIDCVCFDKTGTLTEDGLDLLCVVPIGEKRFDAPITDVDGLPYNTLVCGLVCCHSLTIIDKQITGDPLDLKMFESTKWSIDDPEVADNTKFDMIFPTVFTPPKDRPVALDDNDIDLQIASIREFPFSSSAQRMGVIIRKLGAQHFEYYSKGSPEMILNFVTKESVPDDFGDVLEHYTQEGYRVIAIAHKQLRMSYAKAQKVQREAIEHDMTLLGLIVLENRLKADTTPCIETLNAAHIRVVMVTGDNILTAISVARDCGIVQPHQSVISVNVDPVTSSVYYTLTTNKERDAKVGVGKQLATLSNSSSVVSLDTLESQTATVANGNGNGNGGHGDGLPTMDAYNNYRFALTGKVWTAVKEHYPELIPRLVTRGSIFARMAPDQKQQLVQELQALGYYVAMCGDGANDCGALKAAHTGISLSEAESSVASPFTSKNPNITCVLSIVREGRAALVTSFGIFKYMAAYSLCQFASVLILYSIESNLTDFEFLYIDLFIISIFAFFFGRTAAYKGRLVKETPLNSLISLPPILSLFLQMLLVLGVQVAAFEHVRHETWYVPFNATDKDHKDEVGCVENFTIYTVSSFQYIILAIVFSKGAPYRESVFSNRGLLFSAIAIGAFSVYMAVAPHELLAKQFMLVVPESLTFRLYLLVYAAVHFVLAIVIEVLIIEHWVFKKWRHRFRNKETSKRKYVAIERALQRDAKWPTLTSHWRSAASPMTPLPSCTAEIVFESERFDKNHVLNSFYMQQQAAPDANGGDADDDVFESAVQLAESEMGSAGSFCTADSGCTTAPNTPYRTLPMSKRKMMAVVNGRVRSVSQCEEYVSGGGAITHGQVFELEYIHRPLVVNGDDRQNGDGEESCR